MSDNNVFKFDADATLLNDASKVKSLLAVDEETGLPAAVSLELVAQEAGKNISDAVKLTGNALPTLGEANKYVEVYGGESGRTLTYGATSIPLTAKTHYRLFGDATANTWAVVDSWQNEKGEDGADGATLSQLFNPSKVGGYSIDEVVRDSNYLEYVSLASANTAPLTDDTKWRKKDLVSNEGLLAVINGENIADLLQTANFVVRRYINDTTFTDYSAGYAQTAVGTGLRLDVPNSGSADVIHWINTRIKNPYKLKVNIKLTDISITGGRIGFGFKGSDGNYIGYNISSVGVLYLVNKHIQTSIATGLLTYIAEDIISFEIEGNVLKIYKNESLSYTYTIPLSDFNGEVQIMQRGFPRYIANVDYTNDPIANKLKPIEEDVSNINNEIASINSDLESINNTNNKLIIEEKLTIPNLNRAIRISDGVYLTPTTTELAEATSDFYETTPGEVLYISGKFSLSYGVAGYDASGNWVKALMANNASAQVVIETAIDSVLVVPAGVTKIKGCTINKSTNPFKVKKYRNVNDIIDIKIKDNKPYIIFDKVSNLEFKLHVYYPHRKKFLTHNFERAIYYNNVGAVENLLTKDIWNPVDIYDGVQRIAQGNANFIYRGLHSLDENTHVGSFHGCEVQKYTKFFLDGKKLNIEDMANGTKLECSAFNMTFLSEIYAPDRTISVASDNALPKLDVDDNPIVAENHYMSVDFFADGRCRMRNTLYVKRDGTKYANMYAAMATGYRPFFNYVMLNNSEATVNKHDIVEGSLVVTPTDGSTIDLNSSVFHYCDTVTQWGDDYKIKATIYNLENSRQNKVNVKMYFSYPSPNWLKVYLCPDIVAENPEGNTSLARVFNTGEKIDVLIEREVLI